MRSIRPSRSIHWCFRAPATCSPTQIARPQARTACKPLRVSASALSTGTKSGSGSTPNHTTGNPAAEL